MIVLVLLVVVAVVVHYTSNIECISIVLSYDDVYIWSYGDVVKLSINGMPSSILASFEKSSEPRPRQHHPSPIGVSQS
jgi:hypothetical protein